MKKNTVLGKWGPPLGVEWGHELEKNRVSLGWDSNAVLCPEGKCSRCKVNTAQDSCGLGSLVSVTRTETLADGISHVEAGTAMDRCCRAWG